MKRIVALVLALIFLLSLSACGKKKSDAAVSVDNMIQAIGAVTLDSEAKILEAENEYDKLSDKEKSQVEYYQILVDSRSQYEILVEEKKKAEQEIQYQIEEAYKALEDLDMKKAYELAINLPEDYKDEADKIIKKVDSMCYKDTFFAKLENVASILPKSTDTTPGKAVGGGLTYGHEYSNADQLQTALNDYYKYLNSYYICVSNDGEANNEYGMWYQTYVFEDDNGHSIKVAAANVAGIYFLNINIEENVNYRDVIIATEST